MEPKRPEVEEDEEIEEEIEVDNQEKELVDFDPDNPDEEEGFEYTSYGGINREDDEFDEIVGKLQDIVIEPTFEDLQKKFLDQNCEIFQEGEENKMEYMVAFKNYQKTVESYLEKRLKEELRNFEMSKFFKLLEPRSDQIDDQLLDMLISFTDYQLFKELMLEHKKQLILKREAELRKQKKGKQTKAPQGQPKPKQTQKFEGLEIKGQPSKLHKDEDSDGEERPDLVLDIRGLSLKK
eukprot:TRINITY_DN1690_c0_g1_i10.p1 TRINITY_DN1690_c0_g1~~TRINITY_DN1690_c0_g1_i10.p1  ORF type:complete len:237 (-),score=87.51 TRINITY_DN1690_c0_g1_i10:1166-1876(-)